MGRDTIIERKVYAQGDTIFKQGSTGRTAFIVQKGSVDIVHIDPDGDEKHLANIGAGAIFGEMSLIDDNPRMATARAAEATTVIVVTEQMFLHKLEHADPFIRGLMHIMAETIRTMSDKK
ncbi:cyclic nucleotide-binding domain-containing protein [Pseudomonadota bacterium]